MVERRNGLGLEVKPLRGRVGSVCRSFDGSTLTASRRLIVCVLGQEHRTHAALAKKP